MPSGSHEGAADFGVALAPEFVVAVVKRFVEAFAAGFASTTTPKAPPITTPRAPQSSACHRSRAGPSGLPAQPRLRRRGIERHVTRAQSPHRQYRRDERRAAR